MERSETTHGQADHMRPVDLQLVHDRLDVFTCAVLRVFLGVLRHVGGRITACIEGDAAIAAGKMAHLRFPGPAVACKLVYEYDRNIRSDFLVEEFDAVVGGEKGHAWLRKIGLAPSHRNGGAGDHKANLVRLNLPDATNAMVVTILPDPARLVGAEPAPVANTITRGPPFRDTIG